MKLDHPYASSLYFVSQGFVTKEQQNEAKSKENAWAKTIQDGVEAKLETET